MLFVEPHHQIFESNPRSMLRSDSQLESYKQSRLASVRDENFRAAILSTLTV